MFQRLLAKMTAQLVYTPPTVLFPDKKRMEKSLLKDFGLDVSVYDSWTREPLNICNGDYRIPAEIIRVPKQRGVAVVCHGFGQNRHAMVRHAELLQKLGFSTILFDQRRFGLSKAPHGTLGWIEATDAAAMVHWVKEEMGEATRIVLIGCSMGAITSMNALRYTDQVDAVIEDAGPATMEQVLDPFYANISRKKNPYLHSAFIRAAEKAGVCMEDNRPIDAVAASDVPILCIGSQGDPLIPASDAEKICAVSRNPLSRYEIFGDEPHALSILDYDHYARTATEFLNDTVPLQNKQAN